MRVVGLDPSLNGFGVVELSFPGSVLTRTGLFKTPSDMVFVDRYTTQRDRVLSFLKETPPDMVGVESPPFHASFSEGMYALFVMTNEAIRALGLNVVYFSPGQVKQHAHEFLNRPKGWKMEKSDLIEAARRSSGVAKWNHNVADAHRIACMAGRFWSFLEGEVKESELTPVEKEIFTRTHTFQRGKNAGKTEETGLIYRENDRFFRWSCESGGVRPENSTSLLPPILSREADLHAGSSTGPRTKAP